MPSKKIVSQDNAGKTFNRLTVLREFIVNQKRWWTCLCKCGEVLDIRASDVKLGKTQSCGCLQRERVRRIHNMSKANEYTIWQGMKDRVLNPNSTAFDNYGGRGITIDPEWLDVSQFIRDMGPRPSPKYSIERIDNNGPYSKKNCKWATRDEQRRNNRHVDFITFDGITLCRKDWATRIGMSYTQLSKRLKRGWPIGMALTSPPRTRIDPKLLHKPSIIEPSE